MTWGYGRYDISKVSHELYIYLLLTRCILWFMVDISVLHGLCKQLITAGQHLAKKCGRIKILDAPRVDGED